MNFKLKSIGFFIALAMMAILSSCSDDDDVVAMPTISGLELGHGDEHANNNKAHVGEDIHIEAEILAEGKIDKIMIDIHLEHEGEEHDHGEEGEEHIHELETEFTNYAGMKNTTFHEHIDIPANMEVGEYHFHMTVIDQQGNTGSIEADLIIEEEE